MRSFGGWWMPTAMNSVRVLSCSSLRCSSLTRMAGGRRGSIKSSVDEKVDEEDLLWDKVAELNEEVRESENWKDGEDGRVESNAPVFGRVRRGSGVTFRDLTDGNGVAGTALADPKLVYTISLDRGTKGTVEPSGSARIRAGWGAGEGIVTIGANHGRRRPADAFRPFSVLQPSLRFKFDANMTASSSIVMDREWEWVRVANGWRFHTGGGNLNIPLSLGKGLYAEADE